MTTEEKLDAPLETWEFSTRAISAARAAGFNSLREIRDNLERMALMPNVGHKTMREYKEVIAYATGEETLFNGEQYKKYIFADRLMSARSLLAEVERWLFTAAMEGRMSRERRTDCARRLVSAGNFIQNLPVVNGPDDVHEG